NARSTPAHFNLRAGSAGLHPVLDLGRALPAGERGEQRRSLTVRGVIEELGGALLVGEVCFHDEIGPPGLRPAEILGDLERVDAVAVGAQRRQRPAFFSPAARIDTVPPDVE